jgi:queuosine precursor transporter
MTLDTRTRLFVVLAGVFTTSLIVGDIIGGKLFEMPLFGQTFILTVGMIPFPITFLLTDVLNEFYGKSMARLVTWIGFGLALLAYGFIFIAGAIPIAPMTQSASWDGVNDASFRNVFLGSQRMILASMCAYVVAQFVDIAVFHLLKRLTRDRLLWLRATGSTAVSQAVDTVTISLVAWWGLMSPGEIVSIMLSSYVIKLLIAFGLTPVIYAVHALVERGLGISPVKLADAD